MVQASRTYHRAGQEDLRRRDQELKELGNPDIQIYAIAREQGSGTRDTFNEDIMGDKKAETPVISTIAMGSAEIKIAIVDADNAIGYLGFSYASGGNIEPLSLAGVMPSVQSIRDGSYKLHRHLYFYTFGEPTLSLGSSSIS
ncbi:MAG: hypothetical protein LUQ38_00600 [Methanotrichaceae archaeon]|nr:hypothetical protein [Methanotrichaceae archaeon]